MQFLGEIEGQVPDTETLLRLRSQLDEGGAIELNIKEYDKTTILTTYDPESESFSFVIKYWKNDEGTKVPARVGD